MATIHISEAEAARDFAEVMAKVRAGDELVIEDASGPVVVMRGAEPRGRTLSESIAMADARIAKYGPDPVMDADFAADLEEIIRNRKPRDTSAWD